MQRKLVSLRQIGNLQPIVFKNENGEDEVATAIETANVDGWSLVVKKGEFEVGDFCVYFEIDSWIPRTPWSEFLFKGTEERARIKTIKLKGQISQGLALPITILGPSSEPYSDTGFRVFNYDENGQQTIEKEYELGDDLTAELDIDKWELPLNAQLAGVAKGNFPTFLRKTDEERIQNCFNKLNPLFNQPFVASEKLDGSSFTAYFKDGEFGICSRNLELKESEDNTFWKLAKEIGLKEKLEKVGRNVAIQGEMCGPGIQANKLKLEKVDLFVFNVFDIDTQSFYDYNSFQYTVQKVFELKTVPVIEVFDSLPFANVQEAVDYVTRKSVLNPSVWAEGVVFRPKTEQEVDRFGRLSFKCINPNFLLKYNA